MGYRIEYDRGKGRFEVSEVQKWHLPLIIMGAISILLLFGMIFEPEGLAELRSFLIPGEESVTVQAFQTMKDDLRCGASVSDAVEAFCRFVIHGR